MAELILNKDFGLTAAASVMAAIGLGQNDLAQMIGGMIISPLANPIMRSIMEGDILLNAIKLLILVLTCVVIGMMYFTMYNKNVFEPTERMLSIADTEGRGYLGDIVYGLVAGMVVYASYGANDPNDINILAGLAVGVTILPAFVNAGIMFGAGLSGYRDRDLTNLSYYGLTSSLVGIIYLVFIVIGFWIAKYTNQYYLKHFVDKD